MSCARGLGCMKTLFDWLGTMRIRSWEDRDGRLTFPEFVLLVHLITCCLQGVEVPSLMQGAPPDLVNVVATLTSTPYELDAQRGRSQSSPSSGSSASASWAGSPRAASPSSVLTPAHRRMEDLDTYHSALRMPPRRSNLRSLELESETANRDHSVSASSEGPSSPRFGEERLKLAIPADIGLIRKHLLAMLEADKILSTHLREEADDLDAKARDIREHCGHLVSEVGRYQDDAARYADMQHQLDRQVLYAKRRLTDVFSSRRDAARELRSADAHRAHLQEERTLLQHTLDEEERMLSEMHSSNNSLEESCRSLKKDVYQLERERQAVLEQTVAETQFLQQEKQRNMEMAGGTERLREERLWDSTATKPVGERPLDLFLTPGLESAAPALPSGEPLSWASSLVSGALAPGMSAEFGPAFGSKAPIVPIRGRPPSQREGV